LDKFIIQGGKKLTGEVSISGSKNAALPIMVATLLSPGKYTLTNIPQLRDIRTMAHLLRIIGVKVDFEKNTLYIDTTTADFPEAPYELVKTMRASIYVLGPLLARFQEAKVSLPGGCAWGPRPVDLHLKGIKKLGAQLELENGFIVAHAPKLTGGNIHLDVSSVGATANIMMAAVLANGITTIENAAEEPEIVDLGGFLSQMGARIEGLGSHKITIEGMPGLHPTNYKVIPDRIETGTFLLAGLISGGNIKLKDCEPNHLMKVIDKIRETNTIINIENKEIQLTSPPKIKAIDVTTEVYPGFPTDMQAQWIALMSLAEGSAVVTDTIFNDRFTHVPELARLGAQLVQKNNSVFIQGVKVLKGAPVMSTDLRASASLVIAALAAEGRSDVHRVYHIDRGYDKIELKLQQLGADIKREDAGDVI
jgi:UDP-N-acetylglucosamine 1-carboxyvinyltransferase